MIVSTERIDDTLAVTVAGQVNSSNAPGLADQLFALVGADQRNWVLDLSALEYMSSAGLRIVLMLARQFMEHDRRLILCELQTPVREVFDVSGFLAILDVADTRQDALDQMNSPLS